MRKIWQSAGAMQVLAAALLALALVGIAVSFYANHRWVAIQGPGALQAVSEDTVWLGVDEELWVLDREGHRTAVLAAREFGFTEGISNIVPAPAGQVLLSSRGDRDWQLVDRASLVRLRSIRPQWPADLAKLPLRAVHLAVSPDGDIAAASWGAIPVAYMTTPLSWSFDPRLRPNKRQGVTRRRNRIAILGAMAPLCTTKSRDEQDANAAAMDSPKRFDILSQTMARYLIETLLAFRP